jgi:hypothetical protein
MLLLAYLITLHGDAQREGWIVYWMILVSLIAGLTMVGFIVLTLTWSRLEPGVRKQALLWLCLCL